MGTPDQSKMRDPKLAFLCPELKIFHVRLSCLNPGLFCLSCAIFVA